MHSLEYEMKKTKRTFRSFLFLVPAIMQLFCGAQGTWTQKASMLGNPRYNLLGFTIGENGYIAGGTFGGLSVTNDCQEFDPVANLWAEKSPMPAAFRAGACFAGGNYGYTTTGVNEAMFIEELYEYNVLGDNWASISTFPGEVRMFASGFNIGRNGFISCGSYINLYPLNDLWQYDQLANTWIQKASLPGTERSNATGFSAGTHGYIFGGTDGFVVLNDLWEYNPGTDSWTQKTSLPGQGRTDAVAFTIGDNAYIMGGWPGGGDAFAEVWQYNISTDSWTQLPDFPDNPIAGGAAFSINGLGYVVGGNGTTHCWEYDPLGVGIEEQSAGQMTFCPNPADTKLTVTVDRGSDRGINLCIYDIAGKQVIQKQLLNEDQVTLDVSFLHPGFYILKAEMKEGSETYKLVIK
jgi:N-acetylneuraminic acid mutarotase